MPAIPRPSVMAELGKHLVVTGTMGNEVYLVGDDSVHIKPGGSAYRAACAMHTLQMPGAVLATTALSLNRECLARFDRTEIKILEHPVGAGRENALIFDLRNGAAARPRPMVSLGDPPRPPVEYLAHNPFKNLHLHLSGFHPSEQRQVIDRVLELQPSATFSCCLDEAYLEDSGDEITAVADLCHIVFMSSSEYRLLMESGRLDSVLTDRLGVVTCGPAGAVCLADGIPFYAFTPEARPTVSAIGAGDIFAGAFLGSLVRERDASRALAVACEVAAASVSDYGVGDVMRARHVVSRADLLAHPDAPHISWQGGKIVARSEPTHSEIVEATGLFVIRGGRLLMVTKPGKKSFVPGVLYVPGGKLLEGETPEACARRELREETGLDGGHYRKLSTFTYPSPTQPTVLFRFHQYLVKDTVGDPIPNDDITSCEWCELEGLERGRLFELTWAQLFLSRLLHPF